MAASETFKMVASFTHYDGENQAFLTADERYAIYCQGDGFGRKSKAELLKINGGWDWSHIRDSSPEGERRMLAKLELILDGIARTARKVAHRRKAKAFLLQLVATRNADAAEARQAADAMGPGGARELSGSTVTLAEAMEVSREAFVAAMAECNLTRAAIEGTDHFSRRFNAAAV